MLYHRRGRSCVAILTRGRKDWFPVKRKEEKKWAFFPDCFSHSEVQSTKVNHPIVSKCARHLPKTRRKNEMPCVIDLSRLQTANGPVSLNKWKALTFPSPPIVGTYSAHCILVCYMQGTIFAKVKACLKLAIKMFPLVPYSSGLRLISIYFKKWNVITSLSQLQITEEQKLYEINVIWQIFSSQVLCSRLKLTGLPFTNDYTQS